MIRQHAAGGVAVDAAAGGVIFSAATGFDANAIADVQVRRRLFRGFVRRGLLRRVAAQAMAQWEHGGGFLSRCLGTHRGHRRR